MKTYLAYVRVSTTRQGEEGVSLQEQKRSILEYASKRDITVGEWFEEQISAAKRGRPVFSRMVGMLKSKKSAGLIIHKIDRGSRNLRDWADIGELMDRGIEVHFAHESIDLHTRSGRLSADILAVVAADYIRNLREEVIKGINGRLRQGLFPFSAPVGYLNNGSGKAKTIDPVRGPFIKDAFELYASRKFSLMQLEEELFNRGLRTTRGKRVYKSHLASVLRNPFYMGLIKLENRKEMYPGIHAPLIGSTLYNEVQFILDGKRSHLRRLNPCLLRLLITCEKCGLFVCGERHKGHVYYRCHRKACRASFIREERFETMILNVFKRINIAPEEEPMLNDLLKAFMRDGSEVSQALRRELETEYENVQGSIKSLLQKFLDNSISKETFDEAHVSLLMRRKSCEERLAKFNADQNMYPAMKELLGKLRTLCERFCTGSPDEMRMIIDEVFQSITISGTTIHYAVKPFMEQISNREKSRGGWQALLPVIAREAMRK